MEEPLAPILLATPQSDKPARLQVLEHTPEGLFRYPEDPQHIRNGETRVARNKMYGPRMRPPQTEPKQCRIKRTSNIPACEEEELHTIGEFLFAQVEKRG
jgi:hypothetical protein